MQSSHCWDFVKPDELPEMTVECELPPANRMADIPERIRELWKTCRQNSWQLTKAKDFYNQALQMADYGDDAEIVPFSCYYPTYQAMDIAQLRSYFSIRRQIRKGRYPEVPVSYLFVYVYEILMQVGVSNAAEGWDRLDEIRFGYVEEQPKLMLYLLSWMEDYLAYYRVEERRETWSSYDQISRREDWVLANYAQVDDAELFDVAASLSSYKIKNAVLYKKCPAELTTVAARVVRAAMPLYERRFHCSLDDLCFGERKCTAHPMFLSAVFYSPKPVREAVFEISEQRRYICEHGLWLVEEAEGCLFAKRRDILGTLLREVDCRLRAGRKAVGKMRSNLHDDELATLIQKEISCYLREEEERKRPKIEVDLSKLDRIRADANVVRDALLVEEETEHDPESMPRKEATDAEEKTPLCDEKNALFTPEERNFLRLLLEDGDWRGYLRSIHIPAGVMTDAINEKMMEELQDIALTDEGNGPSVIADYRNDLLSKI